MQRLVGRIKQLPADVADVSFDKRRVRNDLYEEVSHALTRYAFLQLMAPGRGTSPSPLRCLSSIWNQHACLHMCGMHCKKHGNSPAHQWHLVLQCEELTPGSALKLNNKRKARAYYVCILELEPCHRSRVQSWIPLGVLRSCIAKVAIDGGAAVMRQTLENLLLGPLSVQDAGVLPELANTPHQDLSFSTGMAWLVIPWIWTKFGEPFN